MKTPLSLLLPLLLAGLCLTAGCGQRSTEAAAVSAIPDAPDLADVPVR